MFPENLSIISCIFKISVYFFYMSASALRVKNILKISKKSVRFEYLSSYDWSSLAAFDSGCSCGYAKHFIDAHFVSVRHFCSSQAKRRANILQKTIFFSLLQIPLRRLGMLKHQKRCFSSYSVVLVVFV